MYLPDNVLALARTTLRILNDSLFPLDRLTAGASSEMPVAPVFVVGLPRSGTTLAYELLVQAFDVAFLTKMFRYSYGMPVTTTRVMSRLTRNPTARYESSYGRIPGRFAPAENHVLWQRWFDAPGALGHYLPAVLVDLKRAAEANRTVGAMTTIAARQFVFKDVYLAMSPAAILKSFPGARVVVVRRRFDAVCTSFLEARRQRSERRWWSICPPFFEDVAREDVVTQAAFQCVRSRQLLDRELEAVSPDRCVVVEYEDICRSPIDFVSTMRRWLGPMVADRAGSRVPASFEARGPKTVPQHLRERFTGSCDRFSAECEEYLQRVDAFISRVEDSRRPGFHGGDRD